MKRSFLGVLLASLAAGCAAYADGEAETFDGEPIGKESSAIIEVTVVGQRPCWQCASQAQRDAVRAAEAARKEAEQYERAARERKARQLAACLTTKATAETNCHNGANTAYANAASARAQCNVSGGMRCDSVSGTALTNLCIQRGVYAFATSQRNWCLAGIPQARTPQEGLIVGQAVARCETNYIANKRWTEDRCKTGEGGRLNTREVCWDENAAACELDEYQRRADIAVGVTHCVNVALVSFEACVVAP